MQFALQGEGGLIFKEKRVVGFATKATIKQGEGVDYPLMTGFTVTVLPHIGE